MGTELIVVENLKADVLFTKEGELDKALKMVRDRVDAFEPDIETTAGRKEIASFSRKVSSSKVFLDEIRKVQNAKAKKEIDGRNGLWKPAKEKLDLWRDEVRQPLTDFEAEEKRKDEERIADIGERIQGFFSSFYDLKGTGTVKQLESVIMELEAVDIVPEVFFEFTTDATEKRDAVLQAAQLNLETRKRLDKEQADREAEAERFKVEHEKQEAIAAQQKKERDEIYTATRKLADEKAALEAEKKAEQDKKDLEEIQRKAKVQAEADAKEAVAQAEREKAEQERVEAAELKRQEMLKPDREKMIAFAQFLQEGVSVPVVTSDKAKWVLKKAATEIYDIGEEILVATESM